ncbi:MAG: hypothetical protein ABEJ91_02285 [Candidatus Nanohaloarchaea archaeon]
MEMSVELIMVITVTVVVAGIAVFLVQGQSSDLSKVLSGQKDDARCTLLKSKYRSADRNTRCAKKGEIQSKISSLDGCTAPTLSSPNC